MGRRKLVRGALFNLCHVQICNLGKASGYIQDSKRGLDARAPRHRALLGTVQRGARVHQGERAN